MIIQESAVSSTRTRGGRRSALRGVTGVAFAIALISGGVAGAADTRLVGVAGSDSNTVLTRQVADLQARVNKLERTLIDVQRTLKKPDQPDSDDADKPDKKGAGNGKDANGNAGSKDSSSSSGGKPDAASDGGEGNLKDVVPTMVLRAPFVVVDSAGKTIFRVNDPNARSGKGVGDRGVYIYGASGTANISLITLNGGARLSTQSDSGTYAGTLSTVADNAGLKIIRSAQMQTYVGLVGGAKPYIGVFNGGNSAAAALQLDDNSGKGLVAVFNGEQPVAFLSQSDAQPGGGSVTVTDPGGSGIFNAQATGGGGEACVNHNQKTHCLGLGLPLGQ